MLNSVDYSTLLTGLGGIMTPASSFPTYSDYCMYQKLWEAYLDHCAKLLAPKVGLVKKVGLIAMESAPGGLSHPHPNCMFNLVHGGVLGTGDSYLINLFNGVFGGPGSRSHVGKSKIHCFEGLLCALESSVTPSLRPILLLDCLPTDGIKLNKKARVFLTSSHSSVSHVVEKGIKMKFELIDSKLLKPLGLSFNDVKLTFACPPSTIGTHSNLVTAISSAGKGIAVIPVTLNKGPNTIPTSSNLMNLITSGSF